MPKFTKPKTHFAVWWQHNVDAYWDIDTKQDTGVSAHNLIVEYPADAEPDITELRLSHDYCDCCGVRWDMTPAADGCRTITEAWARTHDSGNKTTRIVFLNGITTSNVPGAWDFNGALPQVRKSKW